MQSTDILRFLPRPGEVRLDRFALYAGHHAASDLKPGVVAIVENPRRPIRGHLHERDPASMR